MIKYLGSIISRRFMYYPIGEKVTHIPEYKPFLGSPLDPVNQVKEWQQIFKIRGGDAHVYLRRGFKDRLIYRGFMTVAAVGVGTAFYWIYLLATGTMPKKERKTN